MRGHELMNCKKTNCEITWDPIFCFLECKNSDEFIHGTKGIELFSFKVVLTWYSKNEDLASPTFRDFNAIVLGISNKLM